MDKDKDINLSNIFAAFRLRIGVTWILVLLETVGLTMIPLAMGVAIDGLLGGEHQQLFWLGGLLVALTILSVLRRIYDTRVYGTIRVRLCTILDAQQQGQDVSCKNARIDMGRELVDFMEEELPNLITAVVQIAITLVVLAAYDYRLMLSAVAMTVAVVVTYSLFHWALFQCHAGFNGCRELQVSILATGRPQRLLAHLLALRKWEVRISDREALLYGCIFLAVTAFILYNLYLSAFLDNATAGRLFTILSYSWDYVEAVIALPATLLFFTRIREITRRVMQPTRSTGN